MNNGNLFSIMKISFALKPVLNTATFDLNEFHFLLDIFNDSIN